MPVVSCAATCQLVGQCSRNHAAGVRHPVVRLLTSEDPKKTYTHRGYGISAIFSVLFSPRSWG